MNTPFNKLSPAEAELLALLLEELGEAQQAIGKILRHGYESYNPKQIGGPNNRAALAAELGDVLAAIDMLTASLDLDAWRIGAARMSRPKRVKRYLHHQVRPTPEVR